MKPYKEIILEINASLSQVSKLLDKKVQTGSQSELQEQDERGAKETSVEVEDIQKHFMEFESSSLKAITELVGLGHLVRSKRRADAVADSEVPSHRRRRAFLRQKGKGHSQ